MALLVAAAGSVALVAMPWPWQVSVIAESCWCCGCLFRLWRYRRRYRRVTGFRLSGDGSVEIEARGGTRSVATIAPGTVSLAGIAWFRWRGANGRRYSEFIRRNSQERDEWRRFRVICRHLSAC